MTPTIEKRPSLLVGIQYLRAIAAMAVVAFHAAQRVDGGFPIGEAGVDLFFVISGFIMFSITSPATDPIAFAKDRLLRIVPMYWIATSVFLVIGCLGLFPRLTISWTHVILSYLFIAYPSPDAPFAWPLLVPGWTLNYEMFFYAIFTATLFLPRRIQPFVLSGTLVGLVLAGLAVPASNLVGSFYTDPILIEFGAGILLAAWWKKSGALSPAIGWVLVGAGALALTIAAFLDAAPHRVLLFGGPALLLVAGVLCIEHRPGGVGRRSLPLLLGDASYSIYLWHTMALSVVMKLCGRLGVPAGGAIAIGIVAGAAVGIVAHLAIEKPLLRHFRRPKTRHGLPIPAGCERHPAIPRHPSKKSPAGEGGAVSSGCPGGGHLSKRPDRRDVPQRTKERLHRYATRRSLSIGAVGDGRVA